MAVTVAVVVKFSAFKVPTVFLFSSGMSQAKRLGQCMADGGVWQKGLSLGLFSVLTTLN